MLLLAACGGEPAPMRPCDRIGLLCANDNLPSRLELRDPRGALADLDGDGQVDLITASASSGLSIVWGSLSRQRDYHLEFGGATDVAIGLLDADDRPDIAFITPDPPALHILSGTGSRRLAPGKSLALAGRPRGLWLGHLDGDDRLDALVASNIDSTITVVTEGLTRAVPITVGVDLSAVQAGDLDGDDRLDIVAIDSGDAAIHVALADGDRFAAPRRVATGLAPAYLQLFDFDADGKLDVLTHGKGNDIWFHQGDGAGGFAPARSLVVQLTPSPGFAAFRDEQGRRWLLTIDGDDLVASEVDAADHLVQRVFTDGENAEGLDLDASFVLTQGASGGLLRALFTDFVLAEQWNDRSTSRVPLVFADLETGGPPELLSGSEDTLVVHQQQADLTWSELGRLTVPARVLAVAVADLDADDIPDLVLADDAPSLSVAHGQGAGKFQRADSNILLTAADELAVAPGKGGPTVAVLSRAAETPGLALLRLDAAGQIGEQTTVPLVGTPYHLRAVDVDADADTDLVCLTVDADEAVALVIIPAEDAGWGPPRVRDLTAFLPPYTNFPFSVPYLALGDLDQDGTLDAALLRPFLTARLLNIAADPPPEPIVDGLAWSSYTTIRAAAMADIDGDAVPDLIQCADDNVRVLLAAADGSDPPSSQWLGLNGCILTATPDGQILAAAATPHGLSVLVPSLAPSLGPVVAFPAGPGNMRRLVTGDLNADGLTDLAVADEPVDRDDLDGGSSFAVLFGAPGGRPQRTVLRAGSTFESAELALADFDDRPGDELLAGWSDGTVQVWTHDEADLRLLHTRYYDVHDIAALSLQQRGPDLADLVLLTRPQPGKLAVVAAPRTADGELPEQEATLTLWKGPTKSGTPLMTLADLDGDGLDDIAFVADDTSLVNIVWGHRERKVVVTTVTTLIPPITHLTAADMNGDGTLELVVGARLGVLAFDLRDRKPREPDILVAASVDSSLLVADLESDGRPDILRASDDTLNVTLRAPGHDDRLQLSFSPPWPVLRAAHLDDDGILDLVGIRNGDVTLRLSGAR